MTSGTTVPSTSSLPSTGVDVNSADYNAEYKNGQRFGEGLRNKERDINSRTIDYIRENLINVNINRRVGFQDGFISVFPDEQKDRARDHFSTLWLVASPSE